MLYEVGVISRFADGSFKPGAQITRKHVAAILSRIDVELVPAREAATFSDVSMQNPYYDAIQTLYMTGTIDGANGNFHPDGLRIRVQLAKIFANVFDLQLVEGKEKPFTDVKASDWYAPYVAILASNAKTPF
ncbi:MAG: S-layer homology domain-containing protein [Solibacillus sp.]